MTMINPQPLDVRVKKEQEEKEDERKYKAQAHLYTIIKVARDEDLREQIGKDIYFDLVDHDKVRNFRIQKQTPFNLFKEEVAKEFGIPVELQRFWIWAKRQNNTYRPFRPLTPHKEARTVGALREVSNKAHNAELKLFLEVERGQNLHPVPPPEKSKDDILLFFKLYDPDKEELRYVGRLFLKSYSKPGEILTKLNEMAGFAPNQEIELFEEIKFEPTVMCERLDKRTSFTGSQIEDGDIICLQKRPLPESEGQIRFPDVPSFLEYVKNRQIVHFWPLERPKEDEFCLELAKNHTYDDVVERVAQRLGLFDPSKIRLTPHNCYSQQPEPNPIKYRSVDHLIDMLVHYNQISDILYYEVLDIPLPELHLKTLKVAFHHATKDEAIILNIQLPKQSTVGDVLNEIKTKVELSHPNVELRLLGVFYHKIYKIFPLHEKIENINDQYWTLRAEEIPEEEKNLGPNDLLIHVYHFTKKSSQNQGQVQNFGDPFFLVIHDGETLADIKIRVQKKLQVSDEEFSKWKFAFLLLGRPEYLEDSDIVSSRFQRRDVYGAWEQYLGLEHSDTTPKRAYNASQMEACDGVDSEKFNENVQDINEKDELKEKGGKTRSWVWEHFKWSKGIVTTECPYCHQILKCDSKINGTDGLKRHLKDHCPTSPVYKLKEKGDERQSVLGFKQTAKGHQTLANHSFSQEKCRIALARMCIKDNRPFSLVDDEGFREFAWEMNPLFEIPSRWTVARDCLAIYREEAENVRKLLKNQTVSLTTDTWSSIQNINYMCLTAHWVDDEWVLRKKILNFCPITNQKGLTIGKLVYACLQKWGIDRVFTVTVDNASSNDGAIRYLKTVLRGPDAILDCKYLHLRCCAHIVNLVVRDGLEEQNLAITKIRNAVRYVRSSPAREASFRSSAEKEKIDCTKKLCLDVETRWNSTYLMLKTAEKYAAAFRRLESVDYNFRAYFCDDYDEDCDDNTRKRRRRERIVGPPDASDWERARCFIEFLKLFYKVTNLISGSKFVTSNLFFSELVIMHASISRMCLSFDKYEKEMAMSMKVKYDKYWDNLDNINFLLYVAVVLDPRNKMFYLNYCLGQIHGFQAPKTKEISDRVVATLNELYDYYKEQGEKSIRTSMGSSSSSSFGGISNLTQISSKIDLESNFLKYMEEQGCVANKTEVEIYLSDGMEKRDDKFDILGWWKINAHKFPVLSKVARYVLAMPISTVASESAFSTGGRVIDPFRSSLTPKTSEALICSQDWIRSSPTDIGAPVQVKAIRELQEKLEKLEMDEFATGPKFFAPCLIDD